MEMDVSLNGLEKCLIGDEVFELPQELLEYDHVFKDVFNMSTWKNELNEEQRRYLMKFLPDFPVNNKLEKETTIRQLMGGENIKFGNPLVQYHKKMKSGLLSPEIARYFALCQEEKEKAYHQQQRKYYTDLLVELLKARPRYITAVAQSAPGQPIRVPKPPKPKTETMRKTKELEGKTKRKYKSILREVREECCEPETSSEDSQSESDERVLYSAVIGGGAEASVSTTLSPSSHVSGALDAAHRPDVFRITHEDYYYMLMRHKRRKAKYPNAPEFQTKGHTLEDVIKRVYPSKDGVKEEKVKEEPLSDPQPSAKKRAKERRHSKDGKPKKKSKEGRPSLPGADVTVIKKEEGDASLEDEVVDIETEDASPYGRSLGRYASFFSVIRDTIKEAEDQKITTVKLEEQVRTWQALPQSCLNSWFSLQDCWTDQVHSALKYLAGDMIGMSEDFIPFVDYKERFQLWHWIGDGRDKDAALSAAFEQWLDSQKDEGTDLYSDNQMSPPPPRWVTDYVVKSTTDEEKTEFRQQEKLRFENPHRAFTYRLHGYESVVGPVKGIYSKETSLKVREHSILVKDRPAYVTILTLVRDSCARLPNGEGTRADICTLMKDSMYLSDGIEDIQLNTVVSGALDRLHYEKDPCIKYDVGRKIWIYLHRGRVEEDFEKIHHAQEKAAKAKRSLMKPRVHRGSSSRQSQEKMKLKDAAVHLRRMELSRSSADSGSSDSASKQSHLSKALTLPSGSLHAKFPLNRNNSTPKGGPNSVAGLLQKARQMPSQAPRSLPQQEVKSAPQTIKQLTANPNLSQAFSPTQPLAQRLLVGQTTPMAVFLPSTQPGQQQLTFSLIPAKVPEAGKDVTSATPEASTVRPKISTPPMMPISRIMQQLTKSVVNVSDLIASQSQKKTRKRSKKPSPTQHQLGNVLLSTNQRVQQAQLAAPKLRASDLAAISRASPSASTISQILQSTAAVQASSRSTPGPSISAPASTDSLVAMVSVANPKPVAVPIANTFIPIAPAEIASSSGTIPAALNAPVAIAPAVAAPSTARLTPTAPATTVPVAIATAVVTKPIATPTTVTLGAVATQNVLSAGLQSTEQAKLTPTAPTTHGIVPVSLPAQIIVQTAAPPHNITATSGTRAFAPQGLAAVSACQANQLQLVKTVISQASQGQTSPTTAFIITPNPATSGKMTGKKPAKRQQPVYARIITPPPGLRLNVAPSSVSANIATTVQSTGGTIRAIGAANVLPSTVVTAVPSHQQVLQQTQHHHHQVHVSQALLPQHAPTHQQQQIVAQTIQSTSHLLPLSAQAQQLSAQRQHQQTLSAPSDSKFMAGVEIDLSQNASPFGDLSPKAALAAAIRGRSQISMPVSTTAEIRSETIQDEKH